MRFAPNISNEEVAQLPAAQFGGEIVVVNNMRELLSACAYLSRQKVVGFDTETRPSFKAGVVNTVSLLQLSSAERCYLIRLNKVRFDKCVLRLLQDEKLPKIGVDVAGDIRSLRALRHFTPRGFVDLQQTVATVGIEERSLRKISSLVLGKRVSKAQRLSNWEANALTEQQQLYAATDAWVCIKIFEALSYGDDERPLAAVASRD